MSRFRPRSRNSLISTHRQFLRGPRLPCSSCAVAAPVAAAAAVAAAAGTAPRPSPWRPHASSSSSSTSAGIEAAGSAAEAARQARHRRTDVVGRNQVQGRPQGLRPLLRGVLSAGRHRARAGMRSGGAGWPAGGAAECCLSTRNSIFARGSAKLVWDDSQPTVGQLGAADVGGRARMSVKTL